MECKYFFAYLKLIWTHINLSKNIFVIFFFFTRRSFLRGFLFSCWRLQKVTVIVSIIVGIILLTSTLFWSVICSTLDPFIHIFNVRAKPCYVFHTWISTTLFRKPLFPPSSTDSKPSKPHLELVLSFPGTTFSIKLINPNKLDLAWN